MTDVVCALGGWRGGWGGGAKVSRHLWVRASGRGNPPRIEPAVSEEESVGGRMEDPG